MPVQRATCEPCRLRRVKCDLRERVFVCSNCMRRNLQCPGVQQVPSRKPRRGTMIDRVEREYGSTSSTPTPIIETGTAFADLSSLSSGQTEGNISESVAIVSSAERDMVSLELRTELVASLLQSFMVSHGTFRSVIPQLDWRRGLETLNPFEEVTTRIFVALGARTSMHSAILRGADTSFPLTLGIVREGPCRQLAKMAVERFDALGIWRQPTAEAIRVAISVVYIARSAYPPEYCSPLVNTAVHLLRQFCQSTTSPIDNMDSFALSVGPLVLWIDARCAAEMGNRPLLTEDDLDDIPRLREWVLQPLPDILTSHDKKLDMLHAATIRLTRSFAADFRRPFRRGSSSALGSLPQMWEEQATLAIHVSNYMSACASDLGDLPVDSDQHLDATNRLDRILQFNASIMFVIFSIHEVLHQGVSTLESAEIYRLIAESRAMSELKRVAEHIQIVQGLYQGPIAWVHMTRLFHMLEVIPGWTALLANLEAGQTQVILDGIQQAGWGAEFASHRWIDALNTRGVLLGPSMIDFDLGLELGETTKPINGLQGG
ncbi:hypothetical protein BCR39DRAFT_181143 [Naematelia encephala]|uniref:Zn(2)-C6 fungal-type domain-containing protein n=1 Tax=Naematelia encephala TaxID=71784 RepID=A0A1Y2B395_9TREE|nr:hypothetical protein BCR39DRAFT_181143 [Naematelia encephala]